MYELKTIEVAPELINDKANSNEKIYLSDLPEFQNNDISILYNTVFNKSVTGIGGTTLALKSNDNIIILMPFVEVVNNKENAVKDSFIVKAGVTVPQITKYLKSVEKRKIVSTFDGLTKIVQAYKRANINIYEDFLLVDEWQVMFQQYGLRNEVIRYLLTESTKFTNKCFMTATPIKKEYWFKEFNGLTELVLDYDLAPVTLRHYNSKNIINEAVAVIRTQTEDYNLHFFINSVDTIRDITRTLDLPKEEVRVICSQRDKNEAKLTGYKIETTNSPVKKINFYTSTCFEGCDIFDSKAKIFVLCDGAKAHSLVDISTTLPQIAGRIRDIEDNTVNLIYTSTRYINVSEEEFNKAVEANKEVARKIVEGVTNEEAVKALNLQYINSYYLIREKDNILFEETLLNVDKANFELAKTYHYKANKIATASDKFHPVRVVREWAEEIELIEIEKVKKLSFKEQCLFYIQNREGFIISHIAKEVKEAVDTLGEKRLEELNYHKGNVLNALLVVSDVPVATKIFKSLKVSIGNTYSSKELKEMFASIYSKLEIKATPKGTDINNYYHTKRATVKSGDRRVEVTRIIAPKIIIK